MKPENENLALAVDDVAEQQSAWMLEYEEKQNRSRRFSPMIWIAAAVLAVTILLPVGWFALHTPAVQTSDGPGAYSLSGPYSPGEEDNFSINVVDGILRVEVFGSAADVRRLPVHGVNSAVVPLDLPEKEAFLQALLALDGKTPLAGNGELTGAAFFAVSYRDRYEYGILFSEKEDGTGFMQIRQGHTILCTLALNAEECAAFAACID